MKLAHLVAINTLGVEINPHNFYDESNTDYVISVPDKSTSIIPKSKVELGVAKTTALLQRYPLQPYVKYRFTIIVSNYLDDMESEEVTLIRNLITYLVPFGFHFDLFLDHTLDHTRFYNLDLEGVTYYIHGINKQIESVFVYSEHSESKVTVADFFRYLEDYEPVVVLCLDYETSKSLGRYTKAVSPKVRMLSYFFNNNLVNGSPREINFSNQETLNMLNYVEDTLTFFVGVENKEIAETLCEIISSPGRIFPLPIPGKVSRVYHGYTEGRNGVLVFPNKDGVISSETAEKLSALGLPTSFVYSEDDIADVAYARKICDEAMLSNVSFLGPVPNHFMPGILRAARMVISEDYRVDKSWLKLLDGQVLVSNLSNPYPSSPNYTTLLIPDDHDTGFDEACERIEEAYGDIATILTSKEETDVNTALAAWFHWLFGDEGLKLLG